MSTLTTTTDGTPATPPIHRYSSASALVARAGDAGAFDAEVSGQWTIGGKPNGGYLLAMLGRAALAVTPDVHDHVLAASAHFLRAPDPGPVEITAVALRVGRSASQVRAHLAQGTEPCVEALLTVGHLDPDAAAFWDAGLPEPGGARREDCTRLLGGPPGGMHVALLDQTDIRLAPESAGFTRGEPAGRGELRGWLSLPDGEPFDSTSLLFAVDALPPGTFDVAMSGWVPTLELTVYVRALPVPGPVEVLQRAQLIVDQRVDEACFVWDSAGRLVAQGTQLAGIRLG